MCTSVSDPRQSDPPAPAGELGVRAARKLLSELGRQSDGWTASLLPAASLTEDATAKVVIRDGGGRPAAILLCSSPVAPDQVGRAVAAAARARELLGGAAGEVILDPLASGRVDGLSYAVFPWCFPLSDHRLGWPLQRRRLRPRLLAWLRRKCLVTLHDPTPGEVESSFLAPLEHVARSADLGADVCAAASAAAGRLQGGVWQPRMVLAHNDLWKGNVLLRGPERVFGWGPPAPFVIIDWAGARQDGHPLSDLVRLADSFRLGGRDLAREVDWYCEALGCEQVDTQGYLLAGLGMLGLSPDHFPRDRYVRLVQSCWEKLVASSS